MNRKYASIILAALVVPSGPVRAVAPDAAAGAAKVIWSERISDAQLRALQKTTASVMTAKPAVDVHRSFDVMEMSDFIAFDGFSTLVPKGTILNVPAALRSSMVKGPTGKLLIWSEFLTRNRARITPFEITIEQAIGKTPVDSKRLEAAIRTGMIIVAVIHGSPTSVNRPKAPAPITATVSSR